MDKKEKRNKQKPVPNNLKDFLTEDQLISLARIESFGWEIEFIRRPLFQSPLVIVKGPTDSQIGVLLEDGTIDHNPVGLNLRPKQ